MNSEIEELIKTKQENNEKIFDLSSIKNNIANLPPDQIAKYKKRKALFNDVLTEMDCTVIESNDLHNITAHVPDQYDANEYVLDVINQCNVVFYVKNSEIILVNIDKSDVTLIDAMSNLALWRNNKNPRKKKEYREANSD
jgi:hypothetical protein